MVCLCFKNFYVSDCFGMNPSTSFNTKLLGPDEKKPFGALVGLIFAEGSESRSKRKISVLPLERFDLRKKLQEKKQENHLFFLVKT